MLDFKNFLVENSSENEISESEADALNIELLKHVPKGNRQRPKHTIQFFKESPGAHFGTWSIDEYTEAKFFTPARVYKFIESIKNAVVENGGELRKGSTFTLVFNSYEIVNRSQMKEIFEEITGLDMEKYLIEHRGNVLSKKVGIT